MKNSVLVIAGVLLVFLSFTMQAQSKPGFEFYKGKWNASFDGPMGTVKMVIGFEQADNKTTATIKDEAGKEL